MRRLIPSVALVAGLIASAPNAQAQVAPTGTWTPMTDSTYYMYYGGGATNGTYLYYVTGPSGYTQRYDPSTNGWTTRPSHPNGSVYYCAVAWANGNLWTIGTSYAYGYVWRFDDSGSGTWTGPVTTSFSRHAYGGVATAIGNDIYVFGGYDSSSGYTTNVTRMNVTSLSSPTFTTMASHPGTAQGYYGVLVAYEPIGGLIYLMSGQSIYSMSPSGTGSWSANLGNCPVAHASTYGYCGAMLAGKGRLYVTGGPGGTRLDEFLPGAAQWTQRATAPATHTYYNAGAQMIGPNYGYFFGGSNASYDCSRYTLPVFGADPNDATAVQQSGSTGVMPQNDPNLSWTNTYATFSANITDPDAGQQVAIEVQVKKATDTWANPLPIGPTGGPTASSGMGAQGLRSVTVDLSAFGTDDFDWQYHAVDDYYNFTPNTGGVPAWHQFMKNSVSPDFRTDQQNPSVPVPVYPVSQDVLGPSTSSNDVTFVWNASTDNAPLSALRYTIEVAHDDPAFGTIAASATGLVPTQHTFNLPVSRYNYFWHVGVTDIGGNFSGWSVPNWFRVTGDDGQNHSAGDANRVLGCSSGAGTGALAAMAGLAIAALGLARRMIRK